MFNLIIDLASRCCNTSNLKVWTFFASSSVIVGWNCLIQNTDEAFASGALF
jgi:hypothetical protein